MAEKRTLTTEHLPPGSTAYSWKGEIYVPQPDGSATDINGRPVDLPEDFPSDDDLRANKARAARGGGINPAAPINVSDRPPGSSGSGQPQQRAKGAGGGEGGEDYDEMTKDDLAEMAASRQVEVKRTDGEEGDPLKADYVKALKRADKKAGEQ